MEETEIELKISYFDIMLNYWLSQKLKLLRYGKFNHLTIILTYTIVENSQFFTFFENQKAYYIFEWSIALANSIIYVLIFF